MIFDMCTRLGIEEVLTLLGYTETEKTNILNNTTVIGKSNE
jgi:hypothetical protein